MVNLIDNKSSYLVSIVVPIFNAEKYLERAIFSILSQTYGNIEILCIDDGSSDASLDVLYKYAKKYKNVIVFKQKNKGVSSARNKGIENASGDYIFFCDADDWIDLDLIEKLVKTAKNNPNNDLFACGFYKEFENNKDIKAIITAVPSSDTYEALYKRVKGKKPDEIIKNYRKYLTNYGKGDKSWYL